ERIAYEFVLDAAADGVRYVEVRYSPLLHRPALTLAQAIEAPLAGIKRGETETGTKVGLIVCAIRTRPAGEALELAPAAAEDRAASAQAVSRPRGRGHAQYRRPSGGRDLAHRRVFPGARRPRAHATGARTRDAQRVPERVSAGVRESRAGVARPERTGGSLNVLPPHGAGVRRHVRVRARRVHASPVRLEQPPGSGSPAAGPRVGRFAVDRRSPRNPGGAPLAGAAAHGPVRDRPDSGDRHGAVAQPPRDQLADRGLGTGTAARLRDLRAARAPGTEAVQCV